MKQCVWYLRIAVGSRQNKNHALLDKVWLPEYDDSPKISIKFATRKSFIWVYLIYRRKKVA